MYPFLYRQPTHYVYFFFPKQLTLKNGSVPIVDRPTRLSHGLMFTTSKKQMSTVYFEFNRSLVYRNKFLTSFRIDCGVPQNKLKLLKTFGRV